MTDHSSMPTCPPFPVDDRFSGSGIVPNPRRAAGTRTAPPDRHRRGPLRRVAAGGPVAATGRLAAHGSRPRLSAVLSAVLLTGCAAQEVPQEPITRSAEWFRCKSSFDCIAVFDDYCKYSAVNARYSLVYQDWVRQQVANSGELRPCAREREEIVLTAHCRNQRCEYP